MQDNLESIELKKVIEQISGKICTQRTNSYSEIRMMDAMVDLLDASIQYWHGGRKRCNRTRKRRAYRVKTLHIYNDSSVPIFIAAYGIQPESNQSSLFNLHSVICANSLTTCTEGGMHHSGWDALGHPKPE